MRNKNLVIAEAELSSFGSAGREYRQEAQGSLLVSCEGRHLVG